jgi:hypothetical protein
MRTLEFTQCACLALVLAGCTSSTDARNTRASEAPATGETAPKAGVRSTACNLIPQSEMEQVLGGPLAGTEADDRDDKTTCTYLPPEGRLRYAEVVIEWEGAEEAMAGMRMAASFMNRDAGFSVTEKVEGVGDEAFVLMGGVLNVRRGDVLVTVDLRLQEDAAEKAVEIARTVLSRVPS